MPFAEHRDAPLLEVELDRAVERDLEHEVLLVVPQEQRAGVAVEQIDGLLDDEREHVLRALRVHELDGDALERLQAASPATRGSGGRPWGPLSDLLGGD